MAPHVRRQGTEIKSTMKPTIGYIRATFSSCDIGRGAVGAQGLAVRMVGPATKTTKK